MMMSLYRPASVPLHAPIARYRTMQDNGVPVTPSQTTTSMALAQAVSR